MELALEREKGAGWENLARRTGFIYMLLFGLGALLFTSAGRYLLELINLQADWLGFARVEPTGGIFWLVLTVSMMVNITVLSYYIWRNPLENVRLLVPLIFCKYTSAFLGLVFFLGPYISSASTGGFALLVIFLTDLPLGVWAQYLYARRPSGG